MATEADSEENMRIRNRVMDIYHRFVSDVILEGPVLDHLLAKNVVTDELCGKLKLMIRQEKCRTLLNELFHNGNPRAFLVLRAALVKTDAWIVTMLDQEQNSSRSIDESRVDSVENPSIRNRVLRNRVMDIYQTFVSNVNLDGHVLDYLISKKVVTIEFSNKLKQMARQDKCRALLNEMLDSGNPMAFVILRTALKKNHDWIVALLDQQQNDSNKLADEVKALRLANEQLSQNSKDLTTQLEELNNKLRANSSELNQTRELLEASRRELEQSKISAQQLQEKLLHQQQQVESLENSWRSEIEDTECKLYHVELHEGQQTVEIRSLKQQLSVKCEELKDMANSQGSFTDKLTLMEAAVAAVRQQLADKEVEQEQSKTSLAAALQEKNSVQKELQSQLTDERNKSRDAKAQTQQLEIQLQKHIANEAQLKMDLMYKQIAIDKLSEPSSAAAELMLLKQEIETLRRDNELLKKQGTGSSSGSDAVTDEIVKQWKEMLKDAESRESTLAYQLTEARGDVAQNAERLKEAQSTVSQLTQENQQLLESLNKLKQNQPPDTAARPQPIKMKVIYDYEAPDDDDISMKENEILTDVKVIDDGWIIGSSSDGRRGMFPRNYCEEISDDDYLEPSDKGMYINVYEQLRPIVAGDEANCWADDAANQQVKQRLNAARPENPDTDISSISSPGDYVWYEDVTAIKVNAKPANQPDNVDRSAAAAQKQPAIPVIPSTASTTRVAANALLKTYKSRPELIHSSCDSKVPVVGLTVLNWRLYVVREKSPNIHVYYLKDLKRPPAPIKLKQSTGTLPTSKLAWKFSGAPHIKPCDIASCATNNCLYVSERGTGSILVVILSMSDHSTSSVTHRSWLVDGVPCGLSVTPSNSNLLVCFPIEHRLNEYSHEGKLIHRINLPEAIVRPWKGIEVGLRQWVVCHGIDIDKKTPAAAAVGGDVCASLHRVCLVDGDKKRMSAIHGGPPGPALDQLHEPLSIVTDSQGRILVADCHNNRVKLLGADLQQCEVLLSPGCDELQEPRRLHLFIDSGCLYVGLRNGAILIYRVLA